MPSGSSWSAADRWGRSARAPGAHLFLGRRALALTPNAEGLRSWLNWIEAQFQALRHFALDGTDHACHHEQASMIRRYIIWHNSNAHDRALRKPVKRANVA